MAIKISTRIKTYFGVAVPPWRRITWKKTTTLVFVVTGRIRSKKNELVGVVDRTDAFKLINDKPPGHKFTRAEVVAILFKTFARVINSKEYQEWEDGVVEILKDQLQQQQPSASENGLVFPLSKASVKIKFYWNSKHRRDNSNKGEGLHDALVRAHIIEDDSDRVLNPTNAEAGNYTDEVKDSIAVIYVTTPLPSKK